MKETLTTAAMVCGVVAFIFVTSHYANEFFREKQELKEQKVATDHEARIAKNEENGKRRDRNWAKFNASMRKAQQANLAKKTVSAAPKQVDEGF